MTEKPLAFLSLVKLLEEAVGHKTKYALLEPSPCETTKEGRPSIVLIQNAGKIVAEHAGLGDLTFVIAVRRQDPNTAGHIELRYGSSEVFVEISPEICEHPDAVMATLGHEVAHKFLHTNGLRNGTTQLEQEYLTDVTAVYLGMGKIMLNGCECKSMARSSNAGRTTETTHTLRTGYISRDCFAFVYRLICEMRGIPRATYLMGLADSALQSVLDCERKYGEYFKSDYSGSDKVEELAEELRRVVFELQCRAAQRQLLLRAAGEQLEVMGAVVRDSHAPLFEAQARIASLNQPHNPHLKYLGYIETRESVYELASTSSRRLEKDRTGWKEVEALAPKRNAKAEIEPSLVVECPVDRTRLRVPSGKHQMLVTCASCKYRFIVNSSNAEDMPTAYRPSPIKRGVIRRLKALFARSGKVNA